MLFKIDNKQNYAIWFFNKNLSKSPVSNQEEFWSRNLSSLRARDYLLARGYLRKSLSDLFNINALEIPLYAPPGKPPKLNDGLGFVSISHCKDAFLLGWSKERIGLDIEITNREFNYKEISERFFFENEKNLINQFGQDKSKNLALSMWVLKEAAIKWHNGVIYRDLSNWQIKNNLLINNLINVKLNSCLINYGIWKLGIVFERKLNIKIK